MFVSQVIYLTEALFARNPCAARDEPKMGSVKEEARNASNIVRPSTHGRVEAKHTGDELRIEWMESIIELVKVGGLQQADCVFFFGYGIFPAKELHTLLLLNLSGWISEA